MIYPTPYISSSWWCKHYRHALAHTDDWHALRSRSNIQINHDRKQRGIISSYSTLSSLLLPIPLAARMKNNRASFCLRSGEVSDGKRRNIAIFHVYKRQPRNLKGNYSWTVIYNVAVHRAHRSTALLQYENDFSGTLSAKKLLARVRVI